MVTKCDKRASNELIRVSFGDTESCANYLQHQYPSRFHLPQLCTASTRPPAVAAKIGREAYTQSLFRISAVHAYPSMIGIYQVEMTSITVHIHNHNRHKKIGIDECK
mmetsp:Transcript_36816/g.95324  ORF Transcript_36816/g.95324 Transcript_36816/m.95324 type:complete len:107 (-) Transcript_36816:1991-2311(-)